MTGIAVCLFLFVFYITVYSAFLIRFLPDGQLPIYGLILPMITGHFFVLMSHFVAEGYVAPVFGCVSGECFNMVELVTFVGTAFILLLWYFGVGVLIGWYVGKRKKTTSLSPPSP